MSDNEPASGGTAARDLAQGLAAHVLAWARECGAPEASLGMLRRAVQRVSLANAEGHVCVSLDEIVHDGDDIPQPVGALRSALRDSRVVGTPAEPAFPLILDGDDRLYLRRHYEWERRLAAALVRRANAPEAAYSDEAVERSLAAVFPPLRSRAADWQKLAVALALRRRLVVISGGPGTGKTTTVAAMLAGLLAVQPELRVALAAPTGKAAARMLDALRARAADLPSSLRECLPHESFTIHRLLGVTPQAGRFRHDANHPLACDVLVVDEASMLDLALATRLVEALPADARLILLGDQDQLAAVEAGAVFAELCADPSLSDACRAWLAERCGMAAEALRPPPPRHPTPLRDSVVWLVDSHRFPAGSGIGRLAAGVNAGAGEDVLAWLRGETEGPARWIADDGPAPSEAVWREIEQGQVAYAEALAGFDGDPAPVFAAFDRFRVLCAVREGSRGVDAVNERLARMLRQRLAHRLDPGAASPWYPGRPVLVLRNDALLHLYNGDVGICLPDDAGALRVFFPDPAGGWRTLAPPRVPVHDTAFAMTVHKSQGSEFGYVLVLLPAKAVRVMTRELLYTAVTRAMHGVTVAGSEAVFAAACAMPTRRSSGLVARMEEA